MNGFSKPQLNFSTVDVPLTLIDGIRHRLGLTVKLTYPNRRGQHMTDIETRLVLLENRITVQTFSGLV